MRYLLTTLFITISSISFFGQDTCAYQQKIVSSVSTSLQGFGVTDALDIYEDWIVVGAYGDEEFGNTSGAAYFFERCGSDWIRTDRIIPDDISAMDRFGRGVSIYGDFAAVGSPYDDDMGANSGAVYMYQRQDTGWVFTQKIIASDGSASDWFGWTVKMWGDYMIVGAQNDYTTVSLAGSVFIYKREGDNWVFQEKLIAPDTQPQHKFGLTLEIDNGYIVVGALEDSDNGPQAGAVYLWELVDEAWVYRSKILASNGSEGDQFGKSMAFMGDNLLVSAPQMDTTLVNMGGVYVFEKVTDSTWVEQQLIISPEEIHAENFGVGISASGSRVIAGATRGFGLSEETGAAYVFEVQDNVWNYEQKLISADGQHADFFSVSNAMNGTTIICGAQGEDSNGGNAGSVYTFELQCAPVCTKLINLNDSGSYDFSNMPIQWAEVTTADGFNLGIGTSEGMYDVVPLQDIGDTTQYFADLENSMTYYITISPYNEYGEGGCELILNTDYTTMQVEISEDVSIECGMDLPLLEFTYTDSCSLVSQEITEEIIPGGCSGEYTVLRTVTLEDECNIVSAVQTVTVQDLTPPEVTDFQEIVDVECGVSLPELPPVALDNCGMVEISYTDDVAPECDSQVIRTFEITDECGNVTTVTQTINIAAANSAPDCAELTAPQGASVSLDADLEWNPVSGATSYIVYAGTQSGNWDILNGVQLGNVTSYSDATWPVDETIYVMIEAENEFGVSENCSEYQFETIPVGVEEINQVNLNLFPNPTTGQFMITASVPVTQSDIFIYDINGKQVEFDTETISGEGVRVLLDVTADGLYWVTIPSMEVSKAINVIK